LGHSLPPALPGAIHISALQADLPTCHHLASTRILHLRVNWFAFSTLNHNGTVVFQTTVGEIAVFYPGALPRATNMPPFQGLLTISYYLFLIAYSLFIV
jgi:hypothetical protein